MIDIKLNFAEFVRLFGIYYTVFLNFSFLLMLIYALKVFDDAGSEFWVPEGFWALIKILGFFLLN